MIEGDPAVGPAADLLNSRGHYINSRGFWWITAPNVYTVTDSPVVHFSAEFLLAPWDDWTVDWTNAGCNGCKIIPTNCDCPVYCFAQPGQPNALKGVKVRHSETGRIWIIDGLYDQERNTYAAH